MIEMLRELIDQRVMDEKANYNQKYVDDASRAEGKKIDHSSTDKSIIWEIRDFSGTKKERKRLTGKINDQLYFQSPCSLYYIV